VKLEDHLWIRSVFQPAVFFRCT